MADTTAVLDIVRRNVSLDDRYAADTGTVLLSGVQALVRLTLEQRRRDARRHLNTGLFVSGYQGSPLGGLDLEFGRARRHLEPHGVVFRPGLNEELAATAVAGTQTLGLLPGRRHDGVTGFWYGKNPGLDRAADAIRHGNISGTSPLGGAVAWIGDDPASKSSSVPSSCEPMCRSLMVPVLSPGTVADVVRLGLHAVELSRHAGLWTALKVVTDVADATQSVDIAAAIGGLPEAPLRDAFTPPVMLPPTNLDAEADLIGGRLALATAYARMADLNEITIDSRRPRLAVVASGLGHQAVVRALDDLGIDPGQADELGIRVVRLSMPWPIDRADMRRLCAGVETVLVVEDKLAFLEILVRDALYGIDRPPLVLGKHDEDGRPLLPVRSFVSGDDVASALGRLLDVRDLPERAAARLDRLAEPVVARAGALLPQRTPYFCSGCPHSVSTKAAPDQLVGVGIGCHTMVVLDDGERRGKLTGLTQMGGEGAQWIGMAPFTDDEHFVQNLGDGTFHHSGSLAIRATVAAGANITYKLLYNDAVAMTGGQRPEGKLDVPAVTRLLAAEGVAGIVITTPEPERYDGVALAPGTTVRHRDDLPQVQAELKAGGGVTVIIHDDQCATEKRRLRKRGTLPVPAERVWINERVCEGCGDCGDQATCLSLLPVVTEFGRKTQIQKSSCNVDMTCLKGDCPSFLLITPKPGVEGTRPAAPAPPRSLPEPVRRVPDDVLIRMPGVGGTGVVTVSAILQMAAHLDGRFAGGLEQIGLAQKGGPVISDVRIASAPVEGQLRASNASIDVLLGLDLLGAVTPDTLAASDRTRTVAVLNTSVLPTATMVTDVTAAAASVRHTVRKVDAVTRKDQNVELDAVGLAESLFGDHLPANMIMLGAAFQNGCIPVGVDALEEAIRLNGALVDANTAAFRWGRAAVALPAAVAGAVAAAAPTALAAPAATPALRRRIDRMDVPAPVRTLLMSRAAELTAYQDERHAERYLDRVERVLQEERQRVGPDAVSVTAAFAGGLFKLMAYKDEYEVARLHLDARERQRVDDAYGEGAKVQVLLHPPILRALGVRRKIKLGASAFAAFRVLRAARRVRGTPLDPFGYAEVRKVERGLVPEYVALLDEALAALTPARAGQVVAIAELPDLIRGYEDIKLANIDAFRARAAGLLTHLRDEARPAAAVAR